MTRRPRVPDALVLIFALIVAAQLASYVLPAGEFERDDRRVVPGTWRAVDAEPLAPLAFLTSIPAGLSAAQEIIFFVFIAGGIIGVVRATGAIDALIGAAIGGLASKPGWLVTGMVGLFALGASTVGMAEEYMPFVPILVTLCLALKLDAVVAVGIIYVGAGVGYACAALNPFTVLIAQDIAGLPLTSGQSVRWGLLVVCAGVGIHHILRYAARLRAAPASSLVSDVDYSSGFDLPADVRFTARRVAVVAVLAGGIGLFVYGVAARGWYLAELSAVFLGIGVLAAAAGGSSPDGAARAFIRGASEMTATALLIGFARTIQVVLVEAQVIDTIVNGLARLALRPAGARRGPRHAGRADRLQPVHSLRVGPGVRDDADHGAARRPDRGDAADRGARLPARRRLHEHARSHQRPADGDARAGPDPVPALGRPSSCRFSPSCIWWPAWRWSPRSHSVIDEPASGSGQAAAAHALTKRAAGSARATPGGSLFHASGRVGAIQ